MNEAEARLRSIVGRIARAAPDAFGLDDDLPSRHGIDSLSSLRIAAAIEREFGVRIPDERLQELRTLQALLDVVRAAGGRSGG